jgi:release factor glutamine methyltransferase
MYESLLALDGGADGLELLRRVATEVPSWLAPRGHFIVETSEAQAPTAAEALQRAGLAARVVTDAQLDATAIIATR